MTPTKSKFDLKLGMATREAFGKALVVAGRENKEIGRASCRERV